MKIFSNVRWRFITLCLTVTTLFTAIMGVPAYAIDFSETFYGGQEIAGEDLSVYSSPQWTNKIGTIYKFEGYTVLLQEGPSGYLWVEYSTPSGAKRGYVKIPQDELPGRSDGVAKVTTNSTVYYGRTDQVGKYGTYQQTGTVYAGEVVALLAKNDNWAYVEYNTTSGRKRGYMLYSTLHVYNRPGYLPDFYNYDNEGWSEYISGRRYVYSGPTSLYTQVGWVENEYVTAFDDEWVADANHNEYSSRYIEYQSGGQTKSGFLVFGP